MKGHWQEITSSTPLCHLLHEETRNECHRIRESLHCPLFFGLLLFTDGVSMEVGFLLWKQQKDSFSWWSWTVPSILLKSLFLEKKGIYWRRERDSVVLSKVQCPNKMIFLSASCPSSSFNRYSFLPKTKIDDLSVPWSQNSTKSYQS